MASIPSASGSVHQGLSQLSLSAARPQFELAFNQLQNTVLGRMNKEIQKLNDESNFNKVDAFLQLKVKELEARQPVIRDFAQRAVTARNTVAGMIDRLDGMTAAAVANDAETFNRTRELLAAELKLIPSTSAPTLGLYHDDGIADFQAEGLGVDEFTDSTAAASQVVALRVKLYGLMDSLDNRMTQASYLFEQNESELGSAKLEVEAATMGAKAELIAKINEMRERNGQFLQNMSLIFEIQQDNNEKMAALFQRTNRPPNGSILNLFT